MPLSLNLRKKIHRKIWEPLYTPLPVTTAAGMTFARDKLNLGNGDQTYFFTSGTALYNYATTEEGFGQISSTSFGTGTFGVGTAGCVHPMGPTGTATAGSTTTVTTNISLARNLAGYRIRITGGAQAGQERIILSNTLGTNSVITVQDAFPGAIDNTSVYVLLTGRFWGFMSHATTASLSYYDYALHNVTSRTATGVSASPAGEGYLIGTPGMECVLDTGTVTTGGSGVTVFTDSTRSWIPNQWAYSLLKIISGTGAGTYRTILSNTATTITFNASITTLDTTSVYEIGSFSSNLANGAATTTVTSSLSANWGVNMWTNYQARVVAGTGAGQVRTITGNAANVINVSSAFSPALDATSYYVIEGNDDYMYYLGNNAVTAYRYSMIGNQMMLLSPTAARSAAINNGGNAHYMAMVNDPTWMSQSGAGATTYRQNGRYIYSFRGGASGTLDVFDLAGGTGGATTWISGITYAGASAETFSTGSSSADQDGYIYIQKDLTGRFFRYDASKNELLPINTNVGGSIGTAINGNRLFIDKYFDKTNGKSIRFLYWAVNTGNNIFKMMEV